jgi:hypothetical protein
LPRIAHHFIDLWPRQRFFALQQLIPPPLKFFVNPLMNSFQSKLIPPKTDQC